MLAQSANLSFFLADCVFQFTVKPHELALIAFSEHSKLTCRKLSQFFKTISNFIFQILVFGTIWGTHESSDARTEFLGAKQFPVFAAGVKRVYKRQMYYAVVKFT